MREANCDFCGRPASDSPEAGAAGLLQLKMDADGLWVCSACHPQLSLGPVDETTLGVLPDELQALVGKSAGAICRTMALPETAPFQDVLRAAAKIGYDDDRFMSAWTFLDQWLDGTTVWRSIDGAQKALVAPGGTISITSVG